ncbi:MAG: hypothetical protein KF713_16900 [Turneriella sp.]|nr:hypothetical protein [Turneriella sp.]
MKKISEEIMSNGTRPTVATVFGVLNIIFGGFGLFGILGALAWFSLGAPILGILSVGSSLGSALLLFSGILLVASKKNALSVTNLAILVSLALTAASVIYGVAAGFQTIGTAISTIVVGLVYPALIFFLVLKNENVKSFYASR